MQPVHPLLDVYTIETEEHYEESTLFPETLHSMLTGEEIVGIQLSFWNVPEVQLKFPGSERSSIIA